MVDAAGTNYSTYRAVHRTRVVAANLVLNSVAEQPNRTLGPAAKWMGHGLLVPIVQHRGGSSGGSSGGGSWRWKLDEAALEHMEPGKFFNMDNSRGRLGVNGAITCTGTRRERRSLAAKENGAYEDLVQPSLPFVDYGLSG